VPDRLVLITSLRGGGVMRVTTDKQGKFTIMLAPDTYDLQVPPGASPFPVQRLPQQVTLIAGQTVQVTIELDSGIR
jgi:hypothetical protein